MRILIIEDEEKLVLSLKRGLEIEGYAVDYLTEGDAGLSRILLNHKDYDLIILDLMLPGKDGFEICAEVRQQNINTPILILTARGAIEDKVEVLNSGADDYLIKPFLFEELLARLRALLRRPKESLPSKLSVRDLDLDTVTRTVTRKGKEISLTLKEFNMLEYLMRHAGQVMSREKIIDNLWDFGFDSFSNVVDVHAKNLRKKIDEPYHEKLLETIRGVGYRIKK